MIGAEHVVVGSRWLTRGIIPRTVVVLSITNGVAWLRDEDNGAEFGEVARWVQSNWTRRASRSDAPAMPAEQELYAARAR